MNDRPINNRAWLFVLPVLVFVLFSSLLPMMTVVNYSFQDTMGQNNFFWNGIAWFQNLLDPSTDIGGRFGNALLRNLIFSLVVLFIEVPLGIAVAICIPRHGWKVGATLVMIALPLLIPWNVVGTIWQIFARADIGLLGAALTRMGIHYNDTQDPTSAWATIVVMDVWHWTGMVALLAYAGLKSIPDAFYQAARIDGAGRWSVFRNIELPKLQKVLVIAVLLRFMESFMIYTEPATVTGGGPGEATSFLSLDLVKIALGQVDLGNAGGAVAGLQPDHAVDLLGVLHRDDAARPAEGSVMPSRGRTIGITLYLLALFLPIYWLLNMSFKENGEIMSGLSFWPHHVTFGNYSHIFHDPAWYLGFVHSLEYVAINTVISVTIALPAAYAFSRYRFIGDKHLFFWLLSNLMAPPAVYAMPFFNLYYSIGLFDTVWAVALAHCLFNVPLAVWILEGFISGVPREIDETAALDGYSFPRFFVRIFLPLIANGIGVAAFFCFMFSWVEQLLATTLTTVNAKPIVSVMTRVYSAAGMDWGLLAAAGVLTMIPGAIVIWFVRNHIAKGFALGRV